jgi:hypothetical protein
MFLLLVGLVSGTCFGILIGGLCRQAAYQDAASEALQTESAQHVFNSHFLLACLDDLEEDFFPPSPEDFAMLVDHVLGDAQRYVYQPPYVDAESRIGAFNILGAARTELCEAMATPESLERWWAQMIPTLSRNHDDLIAAAHLAA